MFIELQCDDSAQKELSKMVSSIVSGYDRNDRIHTGL
jgi:hypothetical protein